ncbi:MAG: ABC transporter permease [Halanaerobium sp.]|nr:ABC transporter permease [Halanaerobium sp.]
MKSWLKLFRLEVIKHKRDFLWKVVLLFPLFQTGITFLDFYLRYNFLLQKYAGKGIADPWLILLHENHYTASWYFFLTMGIIVIVGMVDYIEEANGGWKLLLSLPIRRVHLYLAKGLVSFIMVLIAIIINGLGLLAVGKIMGVSSPLPGEALLQYIGWQAVAAAGVISIQQALFSLRRTMLPLILGFGGAVLSPFLLNSGKEYLVNIIPYSYLYGTLERQVVGFSLPHVLAVSIIVFAAGGVFFSRKDII